MIKTVILALLTVTILTLTAHRCPPGLKYISSRGKCYPISLLCSANQYYNKKHQTCYTKSLLCKPGQHYDSKTHKCLAVNTKCSKGYAFNTNFQGCLKTITCKSGYSLNPQYQVCTKNPVHCSKNQIFDYTTQKCVNSKLATSPYQPHLITSGSFKKYVQSYNKSTKLSTHIQNCPPHKPYYQKSSGSCISCSSKYPYFDLTTDKCIKCGFSQYYNGAMHKCVSQTLIPHYPKTISRIGI